MLWIAVVTIVLLALLLGSRRRRRDLKLVVTVSIAEDGSYSIIFEPPTPSAEDLTRLLLVYASKLRWLILSEDAVIQELFRELAREIADVWLRVEGRLLESMPTARELLARPSGPFSVRGGETFTVKYYRRSYSNLQNHSSLQNKLPRPGLAANLPWHFCLLADAISQRLRQPERDAAYAAYVTWCEAAFEGAPPSQSFAYLGHLIRASDVAYEGAAAAA